ncbi:MAG: tetratricopeptide repeat protein [Deltaproteobacteria bacterium]|jgi:CHAT domain-containing protein/tetratricopeptide (TPR) repeat protein|nr:tetratricopeptide repeat protein [Deltaproteobacteria bacterium]
MGPDHPDTLVARMNLAADLGYLGEHAAARDMHALILAARERALGPEHPATLSAKAGLAADLGNLGENAAAQVMFQEVIADSERVLGSDHPDTLAAESGLASVMRCLGEHAAAMALDVRVLAARERALGADHPLALASRYGLALDLTNLGEYAAAGGMLSEVLVARESSLGPDHPDTLASRHLLAVDMASLGEYAAAREMQEQVLEARERALGPDHPDTLAAKGNLASNLASLGEFAAAREMQEQVLEARERVLGPDHPDTLEAGSALASDLGFLGDHAAALEMKARVLEARERVLGHDHPDALESRHNLANEMGRLGDYAAARELHSQVLEGTERALGPDHPDTLAARMSLAADLGNLGERAASRDLLAQVHAARERSQGPDHPDTLRSTTELASALSNLGEHAKAREMLAQVLEARERVLGPDHPDTLTAKSVLSATLASLGEFAAARDLLLEALEAATMNHGTFHALTAEISERLGTVFGGMDDLDKAVFFMKLSVDAAQRTRGSLARLDRDLRRSYLAKVEGRYRDLFSFLMTQGRTAEALAVLGLLKEEELAGLETASLAAPGPDSGAGVPAAGAEETGADLFGGTRDEAARLAFGSAAARSASLRSELADLEARPGAGTLSGEDEARLGTLTWLVREAGQAFREACLEEHWAGKCPGVPLTSSWVAERLAGRQEALSALGRDAALLHAVSADDRLWLVMVTPGSVTASSSGIGRRELARLAGEFREFVSSPSRDPREAGARIYDALIRPLERDLEEAGTATLMLSLDGELRYAPAAALWDGRRWLAERYPTALFTESTAARLADTPPAAEPSVRAMGVTASWPGFPALPGVAAELDAVVRSPESPGGALDGEARLDTDFHRAALAESLASGAPVVHVASHFRLDPASLENTVLLLGDWGRLSLREFSRAADLDFGGLDLLTLSACDTASGSRGGEGREVESLGEVVQRAGASAVLATLMPVDDIATPELMREFYHLRYLEGKDKAEALRGAQLLVMRVTGSASGTGADGTVACGNEADAADAAGVAGRVSPRSACGAGGAGLPVAATATAGPETADSRGTDLGSSRRRGPGPIMPAPRSGRGRRGRIRSTGLHS